MRFCHWLKTRKPTRAPRGRQAPRRQRLFLEVLEGRVVPSLSSTSWTPLGPAPLANGQIPGAGAVSGRITGIATDPQDANTIFIASAGGGVWKTANGGQSWQPLTDTLFDSSGNPVPDFMGAIAETRDSNNNEVIYAGTGEANNAADSYYGDGILVSKNGGATWTLQTANGAFTRMTVSKIVIDPKDSNTVYAALSPFGTNAVFGSDPLAGGNAGIWKSTDGGSTWNNMTLPGSVFAGTVSINATNSTWSDLVIDPTTSSVNGGNAVLFAGVGTAIGIDANNGVYQSNDSGKTWNLVAGLPSGTSVGRIALSLSHVSSSQAVYASIANPNFASSLNELAVSTTGGSSWVNLTANLPTLPGGGKDDYLAPQLQGGYDNVVAVNPTNPNTVFVAGNLGSQGPVTFSGGGIEESTDGGMTWQEINVGTAGTNGPHTDYHALAFDANDKLIVGNDGGAWRLDSNDLKTPKIVWTDLNTSPLSITQFEGIALDPTNPNIAYGGSQDNGTEKFTGQPTWTRFSDPAGGPFVVNGDGGITRVDPTNPQRIYLEESQKTINLGTSADGGKTWSAIGAGITATTPPGLSNPIVNFYAPYALDSSGDILFGTDYLNLSTNQGVKWSTIGVPGAKGFNPNDSPIDAIAVAPSDKNVVYVSVGGGFSSSGKAIPAQIFVTQNAMAGAGNVTWTDIDLPTLPSAVGAHNPLPPGAGANALNSITVDPTMPYTAYAVVNSFTGGGLHVWETTDYGGLWIDKSDNLPDTPVNSVAIGPDDSTLYVGTDNGVYVNPNGGGAWYHFGAGLPNAQVVDLQYIPSQNILAAATHGRGVYEIALSLPTVNVTGIEPPGLNPTSRPSGLQGGIGGSSVTFLGHRYTISFGPDTNFHMFVAMDGGTPIEVHDAKGNEEVGLDAPQVNGSVFFYPSPSLAAYDNQLYLSFTGTDGGVNVVTLALLPSGVFSGTEYSKAVVKGAVSGNQPALGVFGNALFLAFAGTDSNNSINLAFINSPNSAFTNLPTSVGSNGSQLGFDEANNQLFFTPDGISFFSVNLDESTAIPLGSTLTVNGAGGAQLSNAQIMMQVDPNDSMKLQVLVNGTVVYDDLAANIRDVNINGDSNTLTMNFANGNPFPNGVSFDAGTGTNTLDLENGSFPTEVETPTGPASGAISFAGTPFLYSNFATVNDTATVTGSATFHGTPDGETINVIDGGTANGFQATQLNSGGGTFATINFANKAKVTVDGADGAETYTVNYTNPAAGLTNLQVVTGPTDGSVVNVQAIPAGVTTNVVSGAAATVNVGSLAPASGGVAADINGPLVVTNNATKGTLNVDDTGSKSAETGFLTNNSITGLGMAGSITYSGMQNATVGLGSGNDVFNIQSTSATTTVNGGAAFDVFNVGTLAPESGGYLTQLSGKLNLNGASGGTTSMVIDDQLDPANEAYNLTNTTFGSPISALVTYSKVQEIGVNAGTGNDTLVVDSSNGLVSVAKGINFDGGTGFDTLQLVQTGGATQTSDTYSPGPGAGEGTDAITGSGGTQTVSFQNLAPVIDLVPVSTLSVNGTPANNAITYSAGLVDPVHDGLVTVDNFESMEFSNKTNLAINSGAGTDTFSINNPNTPTGLTGISVIGGDPNAGDSLSVKGVAPTLAVDTVGQTIAGASGTGGAVPVSYSNIKSLSVTAGSANTLAVSGSTNYVYTPGTAADAGSLQTDSLPVSFSGFGGGTTLALTGTGGSAGLAVNGTAGNDVFTVAATTGDVTIAGRTTIAPTSIANLTVNGLDGGDTFSVTGPQPYGTISLGGGGALAGDVANLTGNGTAVAANLGGSTATVTGGGLGTVSLPGIETLNLNAGGGNVSLVGTPGTDAFTVNPTGANTATAADGGQAPVVNVTTTGALSVNGNGGSDTLTVNGTSGADTVNVSGTQVAVNSLLPVNYLNIGALQVNGLAGGDTFNVTPAAAVPVNIDGGDPAGVLPGDTLDFVTGPADTVTYTPGPTGDQGAVVVSSNQPVSFSHIERLGAGGAAAAVINGTTGNDVISVIARDGSFAPGADGVQDFTAAVNNGASFLFLNTPSLTINTLAGDDQVNIKAPAPNLAAWNESVTVDGGPNTAVGDQLVVTVPGTSQATYTPASANSGTLAVTNGAGTVADIAIGDIETFVYDGQSGGDTLTMVGNAAANLFTLKPGAANDAGTLSMDATLPVTFQNLGAGGQVIVNGNGGADTLLYYGVGANDNFAVASNVLGGQVNLNARIPVVTVAVPTLTLQGVAGGDTFTLVPTIAASPYTTLNLEAGNLAAGDVANLTAATGAVVNVSGQVVAQNGKTVADSGLGTINLNGAGNQLVYNSVPGVTENINVQAGPAANQGEISVPGVVLVAFVNVPHIAVNGVATDNDTVTFTGTNNTDTYNINLSAAGTTADPVLNLLSSVGATLFTLDNFTGFPMLNVQGLSGADTFNVFTNTTAPGGGRQIFINEQLPAGKKKLTAVLNVFYVFPKPKIVHSTSTQDPDAGLVSLAYAAANYLIQFDGVPTVEIKKT